MKIITVIIVLGMFIRFLVMMPSGALPKYPVYGDVPLEKYKAEHMPYKLSPDKTGHLTDTELSYIKHQNYWGKGIPSRVPFPSHLAMWEQTRRTGKTLLLGHVRNTK